ncbi:MAG: hypothetical protein WD314_12185 [Trueperaceae bacterium]
MARRFKSRGWGGYRLYRNRYGETWLGGAPDDTGIVDLDDPDWHMGLDFMLDVRLSQAEAKEL